MTELTPAEPRRAPFLALGLVILLFVGSAYFARTVDWSRLHTWWTSFGAPKRSAVHAPPKPGAALPVVLPQVFEKLTPQQAVSLNAAVPISKLPNPAAAPFVLPDVSATDRARAVTCLAMAVYYEAGNQGPDGEAAVAQVVLNRMRNPIFPKTVCGVVFQGSDRSTGCQFTFTCDGSLHRRPSDAGWKDAVYVAQRALNGYVQKDVGNATHYHTMWVVPYWESTVLKVAQIGAHIFYRWPGAFGQPLAFHTQYTAGEMEPPLPAGLDPASFNLAAPTIAPTETPKMVAAPEPHVIALVTPATQQAQAAETTKLTTMAAAPELRQPQDGYFSRGPTVIQRLPMQ
jgi:spore germination cell wall hydrolase CwlJ-like protein